jgi:hypothetical protein
MYAPRGGARVTSTSTVPCSCEARTATGVQTICINISYVNVYDRACSLASIRSRSLKPSGARP